MRLALIVLLLAYTMPAIAAAQKPDWCETRRSSETIFSGCGVASSELASEQDAYAALARLLMSRVTVDMRDRRGLATSDTRESASVYDTASYEVRLRSAVSLSALQKRQAKYRRSVYTLLSYDARPLVDRARSRSSAAGRALAHGDIGGAVAACKPAAMESDSIPWLAAVGAFEPDCPKLLELIDAQLRIALGEGHTAKVNFNGRPVRGVYLKAWRGSSSRISVVGPSDERGVVQLPSPGSFTSQSGRVESFDVDWERLPVWRQIPLRVRASRHLQPMAVTVVPIVEGEIHEPVRSRVLDQLHAHLHRNIGDAVSGSALWHLGLNISVRELAPTFGGESVASISIRWSVRDESGATVGGGAIVDQRAAGTDGIAAQEGAIRRAVTAIIAELEHLAPLPPS